jgi:hypothetical protein
MGRTKGSVNTVHTPNVFVLSAEQRLQILASLLIEIICEEQDVT